jgi:hypothetical protein
MPGAAVFEDLAENVALAGLGSCGPNGTWEDGKGDDIVARYAVVGQFGGGRWVKYATRSKTNPTYIKHWPTENHPPSRVALAYTRPATKKVKAMPSSVLFACLGMGVGSTVGTVAGLWCGIKRPARARGGCDSSASSPCPPPPRPPLPRGRGGGRISG